MRVAGGRERWADRSLDANRFVAASTADAVVTGTRDERLALYGERLVARTPTGTYRWAVESGDVLAGVGHEDRAYVAVGTRETRCLDVSSGETAWTYRGSPPDWRPRVQGDVVLVAGTERDDAGGKPLVALDARSGRERWRYAPRDGFVPVATERVSEGAAEVASSDATNGTADAVVYVAGARGSVRAVVDGSDRWRASLNDRRVDGPVTADDTVYVTDTRGVLYAFDAATGDLAWRRALDLPSRALDADDRGVVAVAASTGWHDGDRHRVVAYAPDGSRRYEHVDAGGLRAAFAHRGRAYAVTDAGHLAGYREPGERN